jgi:hypothetical protein
MRIVLAVSVALMYFAGMPTVLRVGAYRFFFYSSDWHEPPHVHVERDLAEAKFWLGPVCLERSNGFGPAELNRVQRIVEEHVELLGRKWDEYFGR